MNNTFFKDKGCILSNNLLNKKGVLKWCFRESPVRPQDTGWRFLSDIDTSDFLSDSHNFSVCSLNTIIQIEPAVLSILDLPVNTDLTLVQKNGKRFFVDKIGNVLQ